MDDVNNVLVNAALVAALVPILVGVGTLLKTVPPFKTTPEWVNIANLIIGPLMALLYTWARADSAKVAATSVELVVAGLSGVAAALAASKLYDAGRAQMALSSKGQARRRRERPAG